MREAPKAFTELREKQKLEAKKLEEAAQREAIWRKHSVDEEYKGKRSLLLAYDDVQLDGYHITILNNDKDHRLTLLVNNNPYIIVSVVGDWLLCNCQEQCNCSRDWEVQTTIRTADKEFSEYGGRPAGFMRRDVWTEVGLAASIAGALDGYSSWLANATSIESAGRNNQMRRTL